VKGYSEANHAPRAVVNGVNGNEIVYLKAGPGETVTLNAEGSSDPDGNGLSFRWYSYKEAGSFDGDIDLKDASDKTVSFVMPDVKSDTTIHIILEVTDDGDPPLTHCRRVVVSIK